jgi:hypothetical protein
MTIASPLAQIETVLGEQLIRADVLRLEIEALRYSAEQDRWQQFVAAIAVGLLIGAVIGCVVVTRAAR